MANRTKPDEFTATTADDPVFEAALDLKIAEMHRTLVKMAQPSSGDAPRNDFRESSLDASVLALTNFRH